MSVQNTFKKNNDNKNTKGYIINTILFYQAKAIAKD